jgi:hypothetical protein
VPGPQEGAEGFRASDPITSELDGQIQQRGSLMFWFRPDRGYAAGASEKPESIPLVDLGGLARVSFEQQGNAINLFVRWDDSVDSANDRHIRVLLPKFPDGDWHHFALHWDAETGLINAFLDGSPFYWTDQRVSPWTNVVASTVTLHADRFALADVRVTAEPFVGDDLREIIGEDELGRLDGLLGAADLGRLDVADLRGETLYESAMASAEEVADWRLEGPGEIAFRDGWMEMKSERPDGPEGHIVTWCPEDFPDRFVAEWDFQLLSENGLCIVFLAARGVNGEDLFDPSLAEREGVFQQYVNGDCASYHLSYYADTPLAPRRTTNLRKNPGLSLVASGPAGVAPNSDAVHRVVLVKAGPRIQMAVDGKKIIDFTDDGETFGPALRDGRIGLRQMQWTAARYRNFQVSQLAGIFEP